jgi:hypothetical protein
MQIGRRPGGTTKLPFRKLNSISPKWIGERTGPHRRGVQNIKFCLAERASAAAAAALGHLKGSWILTANLMA